MNNKVALVLISITSILSAEWLVYASSVPVWVVPCSKTTCGPAKTSDLIPEGEIVVNMVHSVAPSTNCPNVCSELDTAKGHLHVMGTPRDIFCQIWGGPTCFWKRKSK